MGKNVRRYVEISITCFVILLTVDVAVAQATQPVRNPKEGSADAIRSGMATYSARCSGCHGAEGKGAAGGGELIELWSAGGTDQVIFQTIRRGFPNTIKPHSFGPDDEVWSVMAYLKTLDTGRAASPAT